MTGPEEQDTIGQAVGPLPARFFCATFLKLARGERKPIEILGANYAGLGEDLSLHLRAHVQTVR